MANEPITREEMFLAKLGGADVKIPTPITRKEQFLQKAIESAGTGGGGSGGVSSWNDLPAPMPGSHLPKGTPWIEENTLLAETDATGITHPTFGQMWAVYGGVPNLKAGETYTITYNGAAYKCVCQTAPAGLIQDPNAVAMGNFSPVGGENTGEPFAMLVSFAYQEVDIIDLVSSTTVKVGIKGIVAHKVDKRCLPDTMIVNVDTSTMKADKNCNEIWAALQNKQNVFIVSEGGGYLTYMPCVSCTPDALACFIGITPLGTNDGVNGIAEMITVGVKADGTILVKT